MQKIIGVKFKNGSKSYYFDPLDEIFVEGDNVIVETAKGVEFGTVSIANKEIDNSEITHELKPIIRKATEKDKRQVLKLQTQRTEAMKITVEKAEKHGLKLKVVDCEYSFDGKKVTVYFTADGRIDFRELVKDLAGALKARIELRQIYERDDIKMRGSMAPCGRPCCCTTYLQDYEKVTIKMAKVQGLSLNPTKISGMCGKLMCCLKYESDYYIETSKQMPKLHSKIQTPDGEGTVEQLDMLRKEIVVKIFKGEGDYSYNRYNLSELQPQDDDNNDSVEDEEDDESEIIEDNE